MATHSISPGLSWSAWYRAIRAVIVGLNGGMAGLISGSVAFYGMVAVFPIVGATMGIWGLFADPADLVAGLGVLRRLVTPEAYEILEQQLNSLISPDQSALGWATLISVVAAIGASRAGVGALIKGLNEVYGTDRRGGLNHIRASFGITFLLMGVALVAIGCIVVLPVVPALLPLGPLTTLAVASLRWIIALGVVVGALGVIYRFGPNRSGDQTPWVTPGALVAVAIWGAITWVFSTYLANFGSYNQIYGVLGAFVALLVWLYLSAFSVLIGAALNAEIEIRTAVSSGRGDRRDDRGAESATPVEQG